MSLQDVIDWWNEYSKNKREVVSCGAWPAAVPPWADIFLPCCENHDTSYTESEVEYAQGVVEQRKGLKLNALNIKQQADNDFISCVRMRYNNSWFITRPFTSRWGEEYIKLVLANGDRIWFHSVGVIIAEMESGNHPVIKLALERAKTHGSENEEKIIKQAHSRARNSKARD